MPVTIADLQPKPFTVTIKGVELQCKPLRLSHALMITKIGEVFSNPKDANEQIILNTQKDFDGVVADLIPELKGIELDMNASMQLIQQLMDNVSPSDNKELSESGVEISGDPKAEMIG